MYAPAQSISSCNPRDVPPRVDCRRSTAELKRQVRLVITQIAQRHEPPVNSASVSKGTGLSSRGKFELSEDRRALGLLLEHSRWKDFGVAHPRFGASGSANMIGLPNHRDVVFDHYGINRPELVGSPDGYNEFVETKTTVRSTNGTKALFSWDNKQRAHSFLNVASSIMTAYL